MQTVDQVLEDLRRFKEFGLSSRFTIPVATLERILADARAWQSAPPLIKDAIEKARAET